MQNIIDLRHILHRYPELSNKEFDTKRRIRDFMAQFSPDSIIELSKTGIAFVFDSQKQGKTTIFRAELDALPIQEKTNAKYCSQNPEKAHSCGHDGHMAILAALAQEISKHRPAKGRAIMLFQPAEELEQGALDVVNDKNFKNIEPDYIFALHNIPSVKINTLILKNGTFASASKGMTIKLYGKTSHAAEPENGINPAIAISKIIKKLEILKTKKNIFSDLSLFTIINIELGEKAFGTSPGYAEIRITLRAFQNNDMEILTSKTENIIEKVCLNQKLKYKISYSENFPATVNDDSCVQLIEKAAKDNNIEICKIEKPYKWSEDFAYYTNKYKGGFFGLGAGIRQAALHNPDYDFPDEIIEPGVKILFSIYKSLHI